MCDNAQSKCIVTINEVIELNFTDPTDPAAGSSTIILTLGHPLLLVGDDGRSTWTAADQLQEGDQLEAQHARVTVLRSVRLAERYTTHNLALDAEFVFLAGDEVAAHNSRACPFPGATGDHTVWKRDGNGIMKKWHTWIKNTNRHPKDRREWLPGQRFDKYGRPHNGVRTPHIHQPPGVVPDVIPATPGGLPIP